MITVVVVDDHQMVRSGLETLLAGGGDIDVVGTAADGAEAIAAVALLHPDVVMMDMSMPVMDGIDATRQILLDAPDACVVMLTSFADQQHVREAIGAGAVGYVLKDAAPDELREAVRAAAAGGAPLDPRVAPALLAQLRSPERSVPVSEVTDAREAAAPEVTAREIEVLRLVDDGMLNRQIAEHLGISEKTVKAHLTRIFQRLGVTDRKEAVLWARRKGLLDGG